jgi:hypothetical protein
VFRIVSNDFRPRGGKQGLGVANLELNAYALTEKRAIARLLNSQVATVG